MPYYVLDVSEATPIPPPEEDPAEPQMGVGITLGMAREEIRASLQGRIDIEDTRIDFWLNRAYLDLASSRYKADELKYSLRFETEEDQPLYYLPVSIDTTLEVLRVDPNSLHGGVPLEKKDLVWYRRQKETRYIEDRRPSAFFRMNRLLVLWPTPDDVYEIILDYRFSPRQLEGDSDSPMLKQEWHEAWLTLARKKILSAVGEHEASIAVGNEFAGHVRTRLDREGGEEENKIVSSSRPRTQRELRRRGRPGRGYFGGD